jgi:hypothetical protein
MCPCYLFTYRKFLFLYKTNSKLKLTVIEKAFDRIVILKIENKKKFYLFF